MQGKVTMDWTHVMTGLDAHLSDEKVRHPSSVQSYQQQVQEKGSQLRQCQDDNARLMAEKESPGGITVLLATGLMGETGGTPKDLAKSVAANPGNAVGVFPGNANPSGTKRRTGAW